ncbi:MULTISPECIES: 1-deoxy-D-xylulose-5-phosphate synthase [unclassified Streptomyces]|uniref:1-deoxy-D-xylulose-5-phosphate synthase n=1 Tax=unclassified Streptomyces TaxID=2593676 RepID=UPI00381ADE3A
MAPAPHGPDTPVPGTVVPQDVRALDVDGCQRLAADVRAFLIDTVPKTGGHLGANLGTVELTIALHRHFDSPQERIVFDTGHQAYTHKILTGRAARFGTLRARHGLSGFPSRAESEHDTVENSHASTGLAWALGMVLGGARRSVAIVGDGALTGGVAFEALHAIGDRRAPVTVVYNDNGRSYAPTPGRLTLGEPGSESGADGCVSTAPGMFFTALGLAYIGPVDGHDFTALDDAFGAAAAIRGPVVVHVRTRKGQGWQPALRDGVKRLHDVSIPAGPTGRGWGSVFGDALCDLAARDGRIHAITAAMPDTLGLLGFRERFPDRYHDVGICEQLAVSLAAGLAVEGMRPVFAVVSTFLTRAVDQVLFDVALHGLPVTFVVDRAGVTGPDGPSHHGIFDVGLLRLVPGLRIFSPVTEDQLRSLLRDAVARESGPVVIRYPKGGPSATLPVVRATPAATLCRRGTDVCLLAHGSTVTTALRAAELLDHQHHLSVSVWQATQIHPCPDDILADSARYKVVATVEELIAGSGLAAGIYPFLMQRPQQAPRVVEIALPPRFLPWGSREEILAEFGPGVDEVVRRVTNAMEAVGR